MRSLPSVNTGGRVRIGGVCGVGLPSILQSCFGVEARVAFIGSSRSLRMAGREFMMPLVVELISFFASCSVV